MTPERRAVAAARAARREGVAGPSGPPPGGPEGPGSWHDAKHVSARYLSSGNDQRTTRRHVRYAQQEVLWHESRLERVRKCGRTPITDGHVRVRDNAGVAHYVGLATCGSIWACSVCAAKIRYGRAEEISTAAANWDRRGHVYMVTLTMPHDMGMRLKPLISVVADGFRAVVSGRPWRTMRDRYGIVGTIRSMEVTHGENGWHPHLHVLVFMQYRLAEDELADFTGYIQGRWRRYVVKCGYRPPSADHGVDVQRCVQAKDAGRYIAKLQGSGADAGNEMARGDMKSGRKTSRTPFEILDDFRWTGDADDLRLWHEYETATKGRQCITWSRGLRRLLLDQDDDDAPSDDELAAAEVGGDDVAEVPRETWRAITRVPGLRGAVLDAAERGGLAGVNELLAEHGVAAVHPPPEMITRRRE